MAFPGQSIITRLLDDWRKSFRVSRQRLSPEEVFVKFREVLARNNQALEIIADLGEKGSGDYIFDRHYIDEAVARLSASVASSIMSLNDLCQGRYQSLYNRFELLRNDLDDILADSEERQGPLVVPFDRITMGAWGQVGGKAGHLAEMRQDGATRVPDGFAVTTRAFLELLDHNGLLPRYESLCSMVGRREWNVAEFEDLRQGLEDALLAAEPPETLTKALDDVLKELAQEGGADRLAVRSSAPEEDREFSFAGQFHTELDILPETGPVFTACRKVAASLFSKTALQYHRRVMPDEKRLLMAVCCQWMVRSSASGVAYTLDPAEPLSDRMLVVGAWGLGAPIVEGRIPTDTFLVGKGESPEIMARHITVKKEGLFMVGEGGHKMVRLPSEQQRLPCLSDEQIVELAGVIQRLENRARRPLDIEWALGEDGLLYILQSRPLVLASQASERQSKTGGDLVEHEVLVAGLGKVAQQGVGCGVVYSIESGRDLEKVPDNAVLVSRRDSSRYIGVMDRIAAIITETGTPISHMATLCREMRVPCLVGVNGVTNILKNGVEVTVDADNLTVYRGRVQSLLAYRAASGLQLAVSSEFRLLRRVLHRVSMLHLTDPLMDNFTVEGCRSYHDILRFVHEKAVRELVELGRDERRLLRGHLARRLDLPVPVGVMVIDIGGGIRADAARDRVTYREIVSEPFRAILDGMLFPGVWHLGTMPVGFRDMMSSMLNVPAVSLDGSYTGHNIAIIDANYVNLCFRLGYHFNIIDAYCSAQERDNHIYYRFLGGASDMSKRSRRTRMIEKILIEFDFRIRTRGDLLIARHSGLVRGDMIRMLDILGRLVGFTRQLDVKLNSEAMVDYYADAFLAGDYSVVSGANEPVDGYKG